MADQDIMGYSANGLIRDDRANAVAEFVRPAEPKDVDAIAEMAHDYEKDKWWWTPERVAEDLQNFFVEGDPVHGFIRAEPFEGNLVLTLIAVKPEWQRKGVATRLLEALNEIGVEIGATALINCGPKTPEVFKLYEVQGWRYIGDTPQGYKILQKEVSHVRDSEETPSE